MTTDRKEAAAFLDAQDYLGDMHTEFCEHLTDAESKKISKLIRVFAQITDRLEKEEK